MPLQLASACETLNECWLMKFGQSATQRLVCSFQLPVMTLPATQFCLRSLCLVPNLESQHVRKVVPKRHIWEKVHVTYPLPAFPPLKFNFPEDIHQSHGA